MANAYLPHLLGFGVLGLAVAVLTVANVVSGAVVAGFRAIGILKSLGFTPRQVVAVHLTAVLVPAAAGSLLGVTTVTLAAGLAATLTAFGKAVQGTADAVVYAGRAARGETTPEQGDEETEALLRSLPGAADVVALAWLDLYLAGDPQRIQVQFIRGE
ncbi:FtsX-like permease family protein [Streptomyces wuyuanensis]|uniref:FtsX-like permease family protein n=1 Tax=Streptomyces wuyuanensis TaxID=1196353 RepID=A0A1G9XKL0_9ACTN|nr:FtsX-like permease family protein [Streptomyces wuyuanensis]SDM97314.1 FtsX-like permease family protein [Streptomyces wuyuanensis]